MLDTVVYCSAGVGRTGTFIALDCLLEMAKKEGVIDVYGLTNQMRRDRVNMIQTVVRGSPLGWWLLYTYRCGFELSSAVTQHRCTYIKGKIYIFKLRNSY